jgi:hypothetical protein
MVCKEGVTNVDRGSEGRSWGLAEMLMTGSRMHRHVDMQNLTVRRVMIRGVNAHMKGSALLVGSQMLLPAGLLTAGGMLW